MTEGSQYELRKTLGIRRATRFSTPRSEATETLLSSVLSPQFSDNENRGETATILLIQRRTISKYPMFGEPTPHLLASSDAGWGVCKLPLK
jgi:hypothetical protein